MSDSYKIYASQDYVDNKKTSWNDLTDRPFYELLPVTINWDGVYTDNGDNVISELTASIPDVGEETAPTQIVKVSDEVFIGEQLVGADVWEQGSPYNIRITTDMVAVTESCCVVASTLGLLAVVSGKKGEKVVAVSMEGQTINVHFNIPSDGTYFTYPGENNYVRALKTAHTGKQLDPKFIPDSVALDEELHAVAKSGSYNDLADVPTDVSVFTNDAGYLTEHQDISAYALKTELPTTLDDLHPATTADAGKIIMVQSDGKWSVQALETEQWTFTLDDGTEVVKNVVVL